MRVGGGRSAPFFRFWLQNPGWCTFHAVRPTLRSRTPPAIDLNANLLKLDKQAAGPIVAFLLAVATPPQIRGLAAHFAQNRPEIGEGCGQLIQRIGRGRCNRSQFDLGETAGGVPHLRLLRTISVTAVRQIVDWEN